MSRLDPFERAKVSLNPGEVLRVTASGSASVVMLEGGPSGTTTVSNTSQTFGPYSVPARLTVECTSGVADYAPDSQSGPLVAVGGSGAFSLVAPDGGVVALSEAVPVVALTATGTAFTGACEFRGVTVRAISGTPQTVTVYDATSATGTPIATFTIAALGTYYWDGDWATVGNGNGGRRINSTGCHVVISGGTSRTIDMMVG